MDKRVSGELSSRHIKEVSLTNEEGIGDASSSPIKNLFKASSASNKRTKGNGRLQRFWGRLNEWFVRISRDDRSFEDRHW